MARTNISWIDKNSHAYLQFLYVESNLKLAIWGEHMMICIQGKLGIRR